MPYRPYSAQVLKKLKFASRFHLTASQKMGWAGRGLSSMLHEPQSLRSTSRRCGDTEVASITSPTSVADDFNFDPPAFTLGQPSASPRPSTPTRPVRPAAPTQPRRPVMYATRRPTMIRRLRECSPETVAAALSATGVSAEGSDAERVRRLSWCFKLYEPRDVLERWPTDTLRDVAKLQSADRQGCVTALLERYFGD